MSNNFKKRRLSKKKLFIVIVSSLTLITFAGSAINSVSAYTKAKKEKALQMELEAKKEQLEKERLEEMKKYMVGVNHSAKAHSYDATKVSEKLRNYDYSNDGEKIVFLTFDDGVSTTVTPKILDILNENDVHATFFLSGTNLENGGDKSKEIVREMFEQGNAIANHSYSHDYSYLYPNRTLNIDNT